MAEWTLDFIDCAFPHAGARRDLGDRTPLEELSCDVLDRGTVARYRAEFTLVSPDHPWAGLTEGEFLVRVGAAGVSPVDGELHPTRAGLLMLGEGHAITACFPTYLLDYRLEFDSYHQDRFVSNSGTWSGNVFDFWSKVSEEIVLGPGLAPENLMADEDETGRCLTPMQASVREALVNALVNADYEGECPVCVVRENRWLTFVNPVRPDRSGGRSSSRADAAAQTGSDANPCARCTGATSTAARVSHPYNPTLATMFNLIGVGKRSAGGIAMIESACDKAGIPRPRLVFRDDPPRAEFSFDLARLVGGILLHVTTIESVGRRKARRISNRETVLNFIDSHGYITRLDVEEILDLGRSASANLLAAMVREGSIRIFGSGPTTRYLATGPDLPDDDDDADSPDTDD